MPELMKWITAYFAFRSLTWPNADRSLLFLVSEIGELSDAWVQEKAAWVRNNPDRERDVASESTCRECPLVEFLKNMRRVQE